MKYFKITNIKDKDDEWEFYVSSTLENETPAHLALNLQLEDDQYEITEVTKEEFDRETEEDSIRMALHILNAVYESDCPDGSYYIYDRSMGTLETPMPITCKEDLEEYIDFEEDEEERAAEEQEAIEETLQQWHDNFNMEEEE